ncbi:hypothetical protein GGF43_004687, partial [Coemansia sp. RSA 2618]
MAPAGGSKPVDLLSEFNATYSYLFGSLPSEPAAGEPARAASRTNDGLLSPASTEPSKTPSPVHEEASDSDDKSTVSGCSSAEADAPELVEERRREEERKAAELRSRRREMIKQQVAFERMKERHRRQCPGQPTGPPTGSIARWQRDPGGAAMLGQTVQQSASQNPLFASSATINRGFAQGAPPQHAQRMSGSFYSNMAANASMPNIAQSPEALQMQMQMQRPLLVDTATARAAAGAGYPYSAPTFQPPHQHHVHLGFQSPPQLTAHPVKLASMPQPAKNPYLSDSSGDNASDSSSADSSVDTSSTGSSDASYSSFKLSSDPGSAGFEVKDTVPRMVRSVSQPTPRRDIGAQNASNDSSSEESAKSQSSSKRRVRFHETVSVVFNTRHSAAGDDGHSSSDSDNDSSNASVDLAERSPSSAAGSGFAHSPSRRGSGVAGYADDAFDDASALGHLRYQIPAMAPMQWADIDAAALTNSKQSSGTSSRNISPDGAKGRKQRPKHRIETQPLRDREAEREQRRMETAGADRRIEAAPGSSKNSRALAQDSHAGGGETAGSATSDAAEEPQRLDPMTEARRALLGHYNAPSPLITLNNGIPRSTNASSVPRTSSVKVIGPQSFARPKARFSAKPASNNTASNTAGPAKSSWESYKSRQRTQPSSDRQANGGQDAKQPPASTVNPSAADARKTHRESDEFDFSNVLQNFSVTSFEVTKSNEGGVYIRYSDRDKPDECMDDAGDSSGEDDIPLSAIARSRSEPNANTYRRAAADARMSRNPSLLGGSRNPSLSGGPDNKTDGKTDTKTDGKTDTKTDGDGKQDARKRVLVRNSTTNGRTSSDKRRLSRW